MPKTNEQIRGKLFGKVKKIKVTGNFKLDSAKIRKALAGKDSVAYSFCQGCGNLLEITQESAEEFSKLACVNLPKSWQGFYFSTGSCFLCDGKSTAIELKTIEE